MNNEVIMFAAGTGYYSQNKELWRITGHAMLTMQ